MQHYQGQHPNHRMQRREGYAVGQILLNTAMYSAGNAVLALDGYFFYLLATLPKVDRLADYKPPIVSQMIGEDGSLVGEFYLERRNVVPVAKIPKKLLQA